VADDKRMVANNANGGTSLSLNAIVSGGEAGAERAALDVAISRQIPYQGYCPKGRRTEFGAIPSRYNLSETPIDETSQSLWFNVSSSDGTVIFAPPSLRRDSRPVLIVAACRRARRPYVILHSKFELETDLRMIVGFFNAYNPGTLYITGRAEATTKGLYDYVTKVLTSLSFYPRAKKPQPVPAPSSALGPSRESYPGTPIPWAR